MSAQILLIPLIIGIPLLFVLRVYLILPRFHQSVDSRKAHDTCSLGVFLGSGGHTSEMRTLLSGLDFNRYTPRTYVYCPGDDMSLKVINALERNQGSKADSYTFVELPRARRVGQPFSSTIKSSMVTLIVGLYSFFVKPLKSHPARPWVDVLLVNGPGTCVLVVGISWIRRILGIKHTKIIYVESFARVQTLSLSGKILRPFVDTFVFQWPGRDPSMGLSTPARCHKGQTAGNDGSDPKDKQLGIKLDNSGAVYQGWLV